MSTMACRRRRHLLGLLLATSLGLATPAVATLSAEAASATMGDPVLLDLLPPFDDDGGGGDNDDRARRQSQHPPSPPLDVSVEIAIRTLNSAAGCGDAGGRSRGRDAQRFLTSLASSDAFAADAWRRRPVLIGAGHVVAVAAGGHRGDEAEDGSNSAPSCGGGGGGGGWASGLFDLDRDLLPGLDGTYAVAQRTADAIRDGSRADTWAGNVPIASPTTTAAGNDGGGGGGKRRQQPLRSSDLRSALNGGTIFLDHAELSFPAVAALSTLTTSAFGLPTTVSVYATPPGLDVSVPAHSDRQDSIVVQTGGAKRWRVYEPPPPAVRTGGDGQVPADPFSRGKDGNVLTESELGEPVLDVVLSPGDILYVPAGFPHATDTGGAGAAPGTSSASASGGGNGDGGGDDNAIGSSGDDAGSSPPFNGNGTSVHLTIGLDSNVWGLTFAHLRSIVLKRSGLASILGGSATRFDERAARGAAGTVPVGFLAPRGSHGEIVPGNVVDFLCQAGRLRRDGDGRRNGPGDHEGGRLQVGVGRYVDVFVTELKRAMIRLEPDRWIHVLKDVNQPGSTRRGREDMPPADVFVEVSEFVLCRHLPAILDAQDSALSDVALRDPEYGRRAGRYSKVRGDVMRRFNEFSTTAKPAGSASSAAGGGVSEAATDATERWNLKEDGIFLLLILASFVVGGPAVIDIAKDLRTSDNRKEGGKEEKQKKA